MLKGAIVGFGFIAGKGHHPAYLARKDVEIAAVADVSPARLEAARAVSPDARLYSTWQDLLKTETGLDFVDVCTPPAAPRARSRRARRAACRRPRSPGRSRQRARTGGSS